MYLKSSVLAYGHNDRLTVGTKLCTRHKTGVSFQQCVQFTGLLKYLHTVNHSYSEIYSLQVGSEDSVN